MSQQQIPLCYYPTTVVVVDDDRGYVDSLELGLDASIILKTFDSPAKALEFLNEDRQPLLLQQTDSDEEAPAGQIQSNFNINSLYKIAFNKNRFSEIAVVVTDYAMPGKTGLELLSEVSNNKIKKIMLTGEVDHDIAVNAFNDRLIDKFIKKDSVNLMSVLNGAIREQQLNYFMSLSQSVFQSAPQGFFKFFSDSEFLRFFQQYMNRQRISEYYAVDTLGSFLLINEQGQPSWLAVADEELMEAQVYSSETEALSPDVVHMLKKREKMLYFFMDNQAGPDVWHNYLFPIKKLNGVKDCYYSVIEEGWPFRFDASGVLAFADYVNSQ